MEGERSPSSPELGKDPPFLWSQVPSPSLADPDWFWGEHIQAKRARVEATVHDRCLSPHPLLTDHTGARGGRGCPETTRERKRKQSLPVHQGRPRPGPAWDQGTWKGGPRVREQLQLLKRQLRHLHGHIQQAVGPRPSTQRPGGSEKGTGPLGGEQRDGCRSGPRRLDSNCRHSSSKNPSGVRAARVAGVQGQPEEPRPPPPGAQALLGSLRKELTRAVSQAVDSVLQKLLMDPPRPPAPLGRSFQALVPEAGREPTPPGRGAHHDPLALALLPRRAQPPAGVPLGNLPLAKPLDSPLHPVSARSFLKPHQGAPPGPAYSQGEQMRTQLLGPGPSGLWSNSAAQDSPCLSHPSSESAVQPWGAAEPGPSVLSQQRQCPLPFTCPGLASFGLVPSVKTEQRSPQAVRDVLALSSRHVQEGLTPGHLKKAKLMFFFTRYPSSNLLKACFPDVQFSRCVTSQMIKWFSNFREFYYIQMEKAARQAIADGVTNPKTLVVLRDSELFRALSMHYNKGNDFEVPDCFLEISSLTLQEFFRAVSAGRDSDPSWKKPIYKIISKLDSDLPEIFKSSSYPQELFRS
ncbi:prospero homeobox protein 2 [Oryctolagus cuniculus]|uniref:prospero homeobox protein 2 n=1 Tax=Oryctolagus cuniculus TaxID=9986 RepID=UPI0001C62DA3